MQMAKKRRYTRELKLGQTNNFIQLNKYFQNILSFTSLKLFKYYNKVI